MVHGHRRTCLEGYACPDRGPRRVDTGQGLQKDARDARGKIEEGRWSQAQPGTQAPDKDGQRGGVLGVVAARGVGGRTRRARRRTSWFGISTHTYP